METNVIEVNAVLQQIKNILVQDLQLDITIEQIPEDCSLLESGLALDSIVIAELMARLEDKMGVALDYRQLRAELFDNLTALAEFVAMSRKASQVNDQQ